MTKGVPTQATAACLGLSGFAVAVVAGLAANNPADDILSRAIIAMGGLFVLGRLIGAFAERAIDERLMQHMMENPLPSSGVAGDDEEPLLV